MDIMNHAKRAAPLRAGVLPLSDIPPTAAPAVIKLDKAFQRTRELYKILEASESACERSRIGLKFAPFLTQQVWENVADAHYTLLIDYYEFLKEAKGSMSTPIPSSTFEFSPTIQSYSILPRFRHHVIGALMARLDQRRPESNEYIDLFIDRVSAMVRSIAKDINSFDASCQGHCEEILGYFCTIRLRWEKNIGIQEDLRRCARYWYDVASRGDPSRGELYYRQALLLPEKEQAIRLYFQLKALAASKKYNSDGMQQAMALLCQRSSVHDKYGILLAAAACFGKNYKEKPAIITEQKFVLQNLSALSDHERNENECPFCLLAACIVLALYLSNSEEFDDYAGPLTCQMRQRFNIDFPLSILKATLQMAPAASARHVYIWFVYINYLSLTIKGSYLLTSLPWLDIASYCNNILASTSQHTILLENSHGKTDGLLLEGSLFLRGLEISKQIYEDKFLPGSAFGLRMPSDPVSQKIIKLMMIFCKRLHWVKYNSTTHQFVFLGNTDQVSDSPASCASASGTELQFQSAAILASLRNCE
ncbi:hypothetical protein EYR41_006092 [Orbilia oligospora]|uniref:DNA/RNA-binding domain-containing protein n=1 Tax=Orbilia oligospora TaxID=2813651 RepID=A0A8H2E1H9_ORBOL|nr:hypothetical protein EYR41_006092 [Orbilia oligospora]